MAYFIIFSDEECCEKVKKIIKADVEEDLPASMQLLFQGHEYLGRYDNTENLLLNN